MALNSKNYANELKMETKYLHEKGLLSLFLIVFLYELTLQDMQAWALCLFSQGLCFATFEFWSIIL